MSTRERSPYYIEAKRTFQGITDNVFSKIETYDFSEILNYFELWCGRYLRGIRGRLVNTKDGRFLFIRLYNRFMDCYREKLNRSLAWLNFTHFDLALALTIDYKKFAFLKDEFAFCSVAWNRLKAAIRKKYGKFFYLRVLEIQKTGRPHLHILISGIKFIDVAWLRGLWAEKYGGGVQMRIDPVWANGLVYLLKYITKSFKNILENNLYAALLFASNRRAWSLNSVGKMNAVGRMFNAHQRVTKTEPKWIYNGSVGESEFCAFCANKNLPLNDVVIVDASKIDISGFENLFSGGGNYN